MSDNIEAKIASLKNRYNSSHIRETTENEEMYLNKIERIFGKAKRTPLVENENYVYELSGKVRIEVVGGGSTNNHARFFYYVGDVPVQFHSEWTGLFVDGEYITVEHVFRSDMIVVLSVHGERTIDEEVPLGLLDIKPPGATLFFFLSLLCFTICVPSLLFATLSSNIVLFLISIASGFVGVKLWGKDAQKYQNQIALKKIETHYRSKNPLEEEGEEIDEEQPLCLWE